MYEIVHCYRVGLHHDINFLLCYDLGKSSQYMC